MNSGEPLQGARSLETRPRGEHGPGQEPSDFEAQGPCKKAFVGIATATICLLGLRTLALTSDPTRIDAPPRRDHPGRKPPPCTACPGLGDPREIYQIGANKLDDALDWCAELGIGAVTLWVFSTRTSNDRQLKCRASSQQSRRRLRR